MSDWTPDTLKEVIDREFELRDRRDADFRQEVNRRLNEGNRIREQINEERRLYLPREVFERTLVEWSSWRTMVDKLLTTIQAEAAGRTKLIGGFIAVSTLFLGAAVAGFNILTG